MLDDLMNVVRSELHVATVVDIDVDDARGQDNLHGLLARSGLDRPGGSGLDAILPACITVADHVLLDLAEGAACLRLAVLGGSDLPGTVLIVNL